MTATGIDGEERHAVPDEKLVERMLLQSMTGRMDDLEKLVGVAKGIGDVGARNFLKAFCAEFSLKGWPLPALSPPGKGSKPPEQAEA